MTQPLEHVSFDKPDEVREGENSGRIRVVMADRTELDAGPGEITSLPPGHDAWVVGDEPVVAIDWQGASIWAREQEG